MIIMLRVDDDDDGNIIILINPSMEMWKPITTWKCGFRER
jgi:hypothetical protein